MRKILCFFFGHCLVSPISSDVAKTLDAAGIRDRYKRCDRCNERVEPYRALDREWWDR